MPALQLISHLFPMLIESDEIGCKLVTCNCGKKLGDGVSELSTEAEGLFFSNFNLRGFPHQRFVLL